MRAFEPGQIGDVQIRNRIVMAPMISNLGTPRGEVTDQHIRYMTERARGGAGLIITEYTFIDSENSRGSPNELGAYSMDLVPKLARLTEKVHEHGARIFMQLVHAGGKALSGLNRKGNFAPSSVDYLGRIPAEMSVEDMESVKAHFSSAAMLAEKAGFDGVEIHGAHGYLIQEFLSPSLNVRNDAYGGSTENRLRFPQEVIDEIRKSISIAVGIRLSLLEFDEGGYGPDYGFEVAWKLRNLDYVHFSAGRNAPPGSSGSYFIPHHPIVDLIPERLDVPVMAVGSIVNERDVEVALNRVDFVSMGRALLADPYFPRKLRLHSGLPRPCIRCNQACRKLSAGEVRCTVNPDTGLEGLSRTGKVYRGEIDIVGAGVKGLEAAILAAKSGLKTRLHEKMDSIGGQLNTIFESCQRKEFSALLEYYSDTIRRLGIETILGETFKGDGLYCLPDVVYPSIRHGSSVSIDTNIYQYLDEAIRLADSSSVILSERSVLSLDRGRAVGYRKVAEDSGISIMNLDRYDIVRFDRNQYDIRSAMISGRHALSEYLEEREMEYL